MKNSISITIFGGTGDLSYRKLFPALYNIYSNNMFNDDFVVCAIGRRDYSKNDYINIIDGWIKENARVVISEQKLNDFYKHVHYLKMDFTNLVEYKKINDFYLNSAYKNNIVYYAVAPDFFEIISTGLMSVENIDNPKIILEKPFGSSLENAKFLSDRLEEIFGKDNIYRIDHYLGKEMVRNILIIRETNPMFARVWNHEDIESVEISALEKVGVETRGNYYDKAGALKDMVQNHLLQILTIVALEKPDGHITNEQLKVLKDLRPVSKIDVEKSLILGQYEGYQAEEKVNPNSLTETFAALKLFIDNDRWQGVPFYIVTGKKMSKKSIDVTIKFKDISNKGKSNILRIEIQPTEGVYLEFNIKTPGKNSVTTAKMEFCQNCNLVFKLNTPEAYERMLFACIEGDNSWFSKWEQIEYSWKYIEALKKAYNDLKLPLYKYEVGSDGPKKYLSF